MDAQTRESVRKRAACRCEYCAITEEMLPDSDFHVDHVIAVQHGGQSELANLAWACERCNSYKGPNLTAIDSETRAVVLLYNPRTQQWAGHFVNRGALIHGVTPAGRATVQLLRFNTETRVILTASILERT